MSIWCSGWGVESDDHALADEDGRPDCARWVPDYCDNDQCPHDLRAWVDSPLYPRRMRQDNTIACTCRCGPLRYLGSHIFPSVDGEREGTFDLATIAGFLTRDGRDDDAEADAPPHEFVRVAMSGVPDDAERDFWLRRATEALTPLLGEAQAAKAVGVLVAVDALQGCYTELNVVLDGGQVAGLADALASHLKWRATGAPGGQS